MLVWRIASDEIEALRGMSGIEIIEFAGECDDARLDGVFPDQEADLGEEVGKEGECWCCGHCGLL